jgi:tripartite-type tricarboxylate transporter receptor subunit TctC
MAPGATQIKAQRRWPWQRIARWVSLCAWVALSFLPSHAYAAWPERPVTILVPFPPGGANDVVVRAIQGPLGDALGQPIIIENRGGAGGNIGIGAAAHARPDGYTLLMAASGFAVNPSLYAKVPYDPFRDFEPIAEISAFPIIMTVRPDLGVSTLGQLIDRARQKPGALNYATPGVGTLPHLATELLKLDRGIDIVHVVYPGGAQAAQAILSHTVEIAAMSISDANPLVAAGLLKGLAVTSRERWPELPDVPTMAEAGVPAATAETWQGILAPAGTPKDITARLAAALTEIMQRPNMRSTLLHAGFRATGIGPDQFRARLLREVPLWKEVIARAHIKAQ